MQGSMRAVAAPLAIGEIGLSGLIDAFLTLAISKLLGHSSLNTTQRYLDHESLADLAQAAPGLP